MHMPWLVLEGSVAVDAGLGVGCPECLPIELAGVDGLVGAPLPCGPLRQFLAMWPFFPQV